MRAPPHVAHADPHACRRVHDALLTRLSNDDDMEKSLSTFANEMASSAMILGAWRAQKCEGINVQCRSCNAAFVGAG